jgi:hypothetical protein
MDARLMPQSNRAELSGFTFFHPPGFLVELCELLFSWVL